MVGACHHLQAEAAVAGPAQGGREPLGAGGDGHVDVPFPPDGQHRAGDPLQDGGGVVVVDPGHEGQVLDHAVVAQGRVPGRVLVAELVGQDLLQVVATAQPGRPPVEEGQGLGDLVLGHSGVPQHVLDPVRLLRIRADSGAGEADHGGHGGRHGGGQGADPAALAGPEQGDTAGVDAILTGQAVDGGECLGGPVLEALVAPVAAGAAAARLVPGQAGEAGPGQDVGLLVEAVTLGRARPVHERHRRMRPVTRRTPDDAGELGPVVLELHLDGHVAPPPLAW